MKTILEEHSLPSMPPSPVINHIWGYWPSSQGGHIRYMFRSNSDDKWQQIPWIKDCFVFIPFMEPPLKNKSGMIHVLLQLGLIARSSLTPKYLEVTSNT